MLLVLYSTQYFSVNVCRLHRPVGEGILCSNGEEVVYDHDGPESFGCHLGNMC